MHRKRTLDREWQETSQYEQARFLVAYIRSQGLDVQLAADAYGLWVEYLPLHQGIRMSPEINAQIHALRVEILRVLYDDNTKPIRLAGRRKVAS